jgi:hypothetical protein
MADFFRIKPSPNPPARRTLPGVLKAAGVETAFIEMMRFLTFVEHRTGLVWGMQSDARLAELWEVYQTSNRRTQ